jgi:hypothetical protein
LLLLLLLLRRRRFTLYGRPDPDAKLQRVDTSDNNGEPFLFKHGNGRQVSMLHRERGASCNAGARSVCMQCCVHKYPPVCKWFKL